MNNQIYKLIEQAGPIVGNSNHVIFSRVEFQEFMTLLVQFQMNELSSFAKDQRNRCVYMEDDVPASVMIRHLAHIMETDDA